jgi:hypothetical protein
MDKDEKPEEAEIQKEVSFRILGIKKRHYDRKDLIEVVMIVDKEEYEMKFLLDNYNATFFPEFKVVDKYGGNGGFKFIHSFLESVYSKVGYYSEVHQKEKKSNPFNMSEREWWQKSEDENSKEKQAAVDKFNSWIKKNEDYLIQHDLTGFDNEKIEEVVNYLEVRKSFSQPIVIHDEVSLYDLLENAIQNEDYEEAVRIREQLKR